MIRALLLVVSVLGSEALAAQQLLPTKTLLVKNPSSGTRKILWKASEAGFGGTRLTSSAIRRCAAAAASTSSYTRPATPRRRTVGLSAMRSR